MKLISLFCAIFLWGFLTACNVGSFLEDSLTQFSQGVSKDTFTEQQKTDLSLLLKKLHNYTYNNESCVKVRNALDNNATIHSLEQDHNIKPSFIYDEFIQTDPTEGINIPETKEQAILLSIVALWKEEATMEQIEAIVIKIRKCYPQET